MVPSLVSKGVEEVFTLKQNVHVINSVRIGLNLILDKEDNKNKSIIFNYNNSNNERRNN